LDQEIWRFRHHEHQQRLVRLVFDGWVDLMIGRGMRSVLIRVGVIGFLASVMMPCLRGSYNITFMMQLADEVDARVVDVKNEQQNGQQAQTGLPRRAEQRCFSLDLIDHFSAFHAAKYGQVSNSSAGLCQTLPCLLS
jgi:hypothetical protein